MILKTRTQPFCPPLPHCPKSTSSLYWSHHFRDFGGNAILHLPRKNLLNWAVCCQCQNRLTIHNGPEGEIQSEIHRNEYKPTNGELKFRPTTFGFTISSAEHDFQTTMWVHSQSIHLQRFRTPASLTTEQRTYLMIFLSIPSSVLLSNFLRVSGLHEDHLELYQLHSKHTILPFMPLPAFWITWLLTTSHRGRLNFFQPWKEKYAQYSR